MSSASRRRWRTPNIKLASVLTNIMGLSGRAILKALIDGQIDPDYLPTLIDRPVKAPRDKCMPPRAGA